MPPGNHPLYILLGPPYLELLKLHARPSPLPEFASCFHAQEFSVHDGAMTDRARYWPGGIPGHIKCHPEPIPASSFKKEISGWQLFLEENAETRDMDTNRDEYFEVDQRRRLVSQWASMTQQERDSYQDRAPEQNKDSWYPNHLRGDFTQYTHYRFCNFIVPSPLSPRNRALWTKFRIMLYNLEGDDTYLFDATDGDTTIPIPNAAGPGTVLPSNYVRWLYLECANFENMAMTSKGTVVLHAWPSGVSFVDQEALDTGGILLCAIENNGQIGARNRVIPSFLKDPYLQITVLGKSVNGFLEHDDAIKSNFTALRANMEEPLLDVLESRKRYTGGGIDLWSECIERIAPGYLEMEDQGGGMAPDYDHANFRTPEELAQIPWEDELSDGDDGD